MKFNTEIPKKIEVGSSDVNTVCVGLNRTWSYDPAEDGVFYNYETVTDPTFTRWVNNRGLGTSLIAAKMSTGNVSFGGVLWRGINGDGSVAVFNGTNGVYYSRPGVGWAAQGPSGVYPFVSAFDSFCWSSQNDRQIELAGLLVGERYAVQVILADTRQGIDGRTFQVVPISGIRSPYASQRFRFNYTGDNKYAVITMQFTATSDTISFYSYVYEANGNPVGTQVNAIQLFGNVMGRGKTFYVSNLGNDNNDGMSRATPWASLARVNEGSFQAGDSILFERGGYWSGTLNPKGSGSIGNPIVLSAYSDGAHPVIDGSGGMHTILLTDQNYWVIDGFEVRNWSANEAQRYGIFISNDNTGVLRGITIRNNYVHDVMGVRNAIASGTAGRHTGGIQVWNRSLASISDNILIEGNYLERIIGIAIQVWAIAESNINNLAAFTATNVSIRNNTINGCSCEAILAYGTNNETIERNHIAFAGIHGAFPSPIAACYATRHIGGVQQYNHVHDSCMWASGGAESYDGQALGTDVYTDGTFTMQYNYTHDNAGGFANDTWDFAGTSNVICRYNISVNEPRLTFARNNNQTYNNIFYAPVDPYVLHWSSPNFITFNSNIFVCDSISSAFNTQVLTNNIWWNMGAKPSNDVAGVYANPAFFSPVSNLIFRDDYVVYTSTTDINFEINRTNPKRQFGSLDGSTYNNFGEAFFRLGNVRCLELDRTTSSGSSSLAFTPNIAPLVNGPVMLRFFVKNVADGGNPANWLSFQFSNSSYASEPFITDSSVRFGALIRASGECQAFSNGVLQTDPLPWSNFGGTKEFHVVDFIFSDSTLTGSAFSGNGTTVRMFSDGLLLGTYSVSQMTNLFFAYGLLASNWWVHRMTIRMASNPFSYFLDDVGFVPTNTSPSINNGTPPVTLPIDYFGVSMVGNPNRGPIESVYSSILGRPDPAIPRAVTMVEILGRFSLKIPAAGSSSYNFTAIVRDENFRVMQSNVTWSMFPIIAGHSINSSTGQITINSGSTPSRFVVKATAGNITRTFPSSSVI